MQHSEPWHKQPGRHRLNRFYKNDGIQTRVSPRVFTLAQKFKLRGEQRTSRDTCRKPHFYPLKTLWVPEFWNRISFTRAPLLFLEEWRHYISALFVNLSEILHPNYLPRLIYDPSKEDGFYFGDVNICLEVYLVSFNLFICLRNVIL